MRVSVSSEPKTAEPALVPDTMKMRELERLTGVGRETIRFYIREGLLPEPERPKRNVARYGPQHVERLKFIKKLQQERFLPLAAIKTLVRAQEQSAPQDLDGFVGLENALYPLLADPKNLEPQRYERVAQANDLKIADLDTLVKIGLVSYEDRNGEKWLDSRNARIVALWGNLHAAGFTEDIGYPTEIWALYARFVADLAEEEARIFYGNLEETMDQAEAASLAADGIRIMNEMMPLLRTNALIRKVTEISDARAGGEGSDEAD